VPDSRIQVGVIGRPHGVRGHVRVASHTADPADLTAYGPVSDAAGQRYVLRWVSDWSWAYGREQAPAAVLQYQYRVHDFVRSLTRLSLCTVHCEKLGRSSLLAMVADHRRAARPPQCVV